MKTPMVTIAITCYNYANYVGEAIESALNQTHDNLEVIVIDDGSTDNSLEVINKYKLDIQVITRKNKGIVYTRNEALRVAKGEFLCFLDADDYFDKDYVEKMVAVALEYDADVVYPNWRIFGDEEYTKEFEEFDLQLLIEQQIHCTSESLIRLDAVGKNRFESETVAEDWDFFLGLALGGKKFKHAKDCYINYRVRSNTRSSQRDYWSDMYFFVEILQKWQTEYPQRVQPLDLPAYAGRSRDKHIEDLNKIIIEKDEAITHQRSIIEDNIAVRSRLDSELKEALTSRDELVQSREYRAGKRLVKPLYFAKSNIKVIERQLILARKKLKDVRIDVSYRKQLNEVSPANNNQDGKFAVVIHLFYLENWSLFVRKLKLLPKKGFDLYITMPAHNQHFITTIKKDFPNVQVIIAPNRGRDVLPFMKVLSVLKDNNYSAILKFHSKKSTHWEGGQNWLETMLDEIIPEDKNVLEKILKIAESGEFGVIGPKSVYYPLTVNFPANNRHIKHVLSEVYGEGRAEKVVAERAEYGFFGGTMFWLGASSLKELSSYSLANYFEEEAGQIDGTFAHAIERLLSIMPQINKATIYEANEKNVSKRDYKSDNIPEWSEDHDK